MLNLKKTAIAVLALSSSAVFAGTMGPICTPGNVTVPCEKPAWDFGGYALYLEPAYTDYAGFTHTPANFDGTNFRGFRSNPAWGWGFKIEGSYHFGTGNDFNVNWYHWNRTTRNAYAGTIIVPDLNGVDADPGDLPFTTAARRFGPRWDAVNMEFGQHVDFSEFDSIRFHAGAQYARVKHNINAGGTDALGTSTTVNARTTFNGFGPRIGADMNYGFGNGFGIYGNGAAAVLVGNANNNMLIATNFTAPGAFNTGYGSRIVVPELEGKLGIKYTYCAAPGDLDLDVGWMWNNYFNVNQLRNYATGSSANTNFAVQGLVFGLKWVGNV